MYSGKRHSNDFVWDNFSPDSLLVLAVLPPWSNSIHTHTGAPRARSHGRHTCQTQIILARSTIISLEGLLLKEESICTLKCRFCFLPPRSILWWPAAAAAILATTIPSQQTSVSKGRTVFGISQADPNSLSKASGWEHPAKRTSTM